MKINRKTSWIIWSGIFISLLFGLLNMQKSYALDVTDGKLETQVKELAPFNAIDINGKFDITIGQDVQHQLVIAADERKLPQISVTVVDNVLFVSTKIDKNLSSSRPIQLNIMADELQSISIVGNNNVMIAGLTGDYVTMTFSGDNTVDVEGDIKHLVIHSSGRSHLTAQVLAAQLIKLNVGGIASIILNGKVEEFKIYSGGKIDVIADNLKARNVLLKGTGTSDIKLHVTDILTVEAMGHSRIRYKGKPKKINNNSFGKIILEPIH
jgi:Putative auto-transporter adhesin, head GIN domain